MSRLAEQAYRKETEIVPYYEKDNNCYRFICAIGFVYFDRQGG